MDKSLFFTVLDGLDERNEYQRSRNEKRQYQRSVNLFATYQDNVTDGYP
jgi:hypothetical protein